MASRRAMNIRVDRDGLGQSDGVPAHALSEEFFPYVTFP